MINSNRILLAIGAAALLLTSASDTARAADDPAKLLAAEIGWFAGMTNNEAWTAYDLEKHPSSAECTEMIAKYKKKGLKDSDVIADSRFKDHPDAKKNGRDYEITVAGASWVCERYVTHHAFQKLRVDVQLGFDMAAWMKMVKPEEAGATKDLDKKPKACLAALDAMVKLGKTGSDVIKLKDSKKTTVDEARVVCEKAVADAQAFEASVTGREKADEERRTAKYAAAGIKGKRLELFAYYDMEWYLPGCKSSTDDPQKLKKAKKLFRWATDGDGVITIQKYVFKGDNYKLTEKTYLTEAKAYRGCK